MKNILFILMLLPFGILAQAPNSFKEAEQLLKDLGNTLINDTIKEKRVFAAKQIGVILEKTLKQDNSFEYPFESLAFLSKLSPKDNSFRIFTWQLYEDVDIYRYYGIIQTAGKAPKIIVLNDQSENIEEDDLNYETFDKDNWYGALYYNIQEYKTSNGKRYLLFGFDGYRLFDKRKLIDVLYFEDGEPMFGEPTFFPTEEDRPDLAFSRFVLTYSAATSIRMNYDEMMDMVVYDNLIGGRAMEGGTQSFLPDGSYRGYELKKGRWISKEKLFNHTWDRAPVPQPILNKGRKDKNIFGN